MVVGGDGEDVVVVGGDGEDVVVVGGDGEDVVVVGGDGEDVVVVGGDGEDVVVVGWLMINGWIVEVVVVEEVGVGWRTKCTTHTINITIVQPNNPFQWN